MVVVTQQWVPSGEDAVDQLWRQLCRLAVVARRQLAGHRDRMAHDPEYRAAVECLISRLSARPGPFGQAARAVAGVNALMMEMER